MDCLKTRNLISVNRFSKLSELQKRIEKTEYQAGWTMTGMAMKEALALFKKDQRPEKATAKV